VRLRALRAAVIGEAGVALALGLAGIAGLTTFVAAAGPRVIAGEQTTAVRQAVAAIPPMQSALLTSGSWIPVARTHASPTLTQLVKFGEGLEGSMVPPLSAEPAATRIWITGPKFPLVQTTKGQANAGIFSGAAAPRMQVSYDSEFAADSKLVAGRLPETITTGGPGGSAGDRNALVVQVAITPPTAATFGLHAGSIMDLGVAYGNQLVDLEVTGIVQPSPGQFWNSTQVVAIPTPPSKYQAYWLGGAVIGQSELAELQATLWSGQPVQGIWYMQPRLSAMTPALLSPTVSSVSALIAGSAADSAEGHAGLHFTQIPQITSSLAPVLDGIQSQLGAGNSLDEFVIAAILAAALLLILICAGLAAQQYDAEFSLIRARGGSVGQLARRGFYRALGTAGPGVVVGLALAIAVGGSGSFIAIAWVLPAITAVVALASVPARSAWRARLPAAARGARQAEMAGQRRSGRRIMAELTVVLAGLAAVVALEVRGLAGGTDALGLASPLLVAAAVSIAIARLYPLPVRALLPLTNRSRGPVGFLGLARAGRAAPATILPALALVLTLTMAAFGWMMDHSATEGQVTSSWQQSGADAIVTAAGNNVITGGGQAAFDKVPGVTHTALVYTTTATSEFAPTLFPAGNQGVGAGQSFNTGLLVTSPRQYAAMAASTPWPRFPASALSERSGPVPILISATASADAGGRGFTGAHQVLELDGIDMQVVVAGKIAQTPAFPGAGNYVVLPQWAVGRFPSIAGMTTLLATGPSLSATRLTAVADAYVPGGQVVIRSQILHALRTSATQYAIQLFTLSIWASAGLSIVALIFGLAATASSRNQLRTRMSALGMSTRQSGALALTDTIPLLVVAILGTAAAAATLVVISRNIVNLAPLTGSGSPVGVTLTVPALLAPAAAVVVLALGGVAFEQWRANRGESATALRTEESW
jgi:putative ABC transport system permease protein